MQTETAIETAFDTFPKRIKSPLTKAEIATKSEQLRSLMNQHREAKSDAAVLAARHKQEKTAAEARVTEYEKDVDILLDQINSGEEIKEVMCKEIPNKEAGVIEIHRLDVSPRSPLRVVDKRPMDLIGLMNTTDADADEANALADAAAEVIKPKKAKKAKKEAPAEDVTDAQAEAAPKKAKRAKSNGNGRAVEGADLAGVEDMPPLVSSPVVAFPTKAEREHEV